MSAKGEGLQRVSDHAHAYIQGSGGFGLSNAGVVADGGDVLLVDTLMDLAHTRRLLEAVARDVGGPVRRLVNTHHNGDHCWGNQLVEGAEIIGHRACAELMASIPPAALQMMKDAPADTPLMEFVQRMLGPFDFTGIELRPPTRLVEDVLDLDVGGVTAQVRYVGPAHTAGDVVVVLPQEGVVFTGDVVFRLCTPIGWEGTFAKWIEALELVAGLGTVLVPGHGPVCGPEGALEMRDYLVYVREEAGRRFEAGMSEEAAAADIDPGPYGRWGEPERIIFSVSRAYREIRGEPPDAPVDFLAMVAYMAEHREGQ